MEKFAEAGFEYKGYTYFPEWDNFGEALFTNEGSYDHAFDTPFGTRVYASFWAGTPASEKAIRKWIDLGCPSRDVVNEGLRVQLPLNLTNLTDYEERIKA